MTTGNALALYFKQRGDWVYYLHTVYYPSKHAPNAQAQIFYTQATAIWKNVNVSQDVPTFGNMINFDFYSDATGQFIAFGVDNNNNGRGVNNLTTSQYAGMYNIWLGKNAGGTKNRNFQIYCESTATIRGYISAYYLGGIR